MRRTSASPRKYTAVPAWESGSHRGPHGLLLAFLRRLASPCLWAKLLGLFCLSILIAVYVVLNSPLRHVPGMAIRGSQQKFLILTMQRSGSGLLVSYLNNHTSIRCEGELMRTAMRRYYKKTKVSLARQISNMTLWTSQFAQQVEMVERCYFCRAVGFKFMYDQGYVKPTSRLGLFSADKRASRQWHEDVHRYDAAVNAEVQRTLEDENFKIIHLIRRNKLRQFVSKTQSIIDSKDHGARYGARHTAHPKTKEEVARHRERKVQVSPQSLRTILRMRMSEDEAATAALASWEKTGNVLRIYYRELHQQPVGTLRRVQNFLGVQPQELLTTLLPVHEGVHVSQGFRESDWGRLRDMLNGDPQFREWIEVSDEYP